jgi:hypothetical protein
MERKTIIRPGYDCRVKCTHETPGDHGICGDEWVFIVMDGERAVSLNILSSDYPPTVERVGMPGILERAIPGALTWHRYAPDGHECPWVAGGTCENDSTYTGARDFWKAHAVGEQSEQPESFWKALEAELSEPGEREGFDSLLKQLGELMQRGRAAAGN